MKYTVAARPLARRPRTGLVAPDSKQQCAPPDDAATCRARRSAAGRRVRRDPARKQITELEHALAKATGRAERAELIIDAPQKFSQLLGLTLPPLADLGVTKSHSRPSVSNDHPYSEAQCKTLKYRPDFPTRFGSLEDARAHGEGFFRWYNTEHHHSGLGLHTPFDVHHQLADARNAARADVLTAAYAARPERFVHGLPTPRALPTAAWINPPHRDHQPTSLSKPHPPGVSNSLTGSRAPSFPITHPSSIRSTASGTGTASTAPRASYSINSCATHRDRAGTSRAAGAQRPQWPEFFPRRAQAVRGTAIAKAVVPAPGRDHHSRFSLQRTVHIGSAQFIVRGGRRGRWGSLSGQGRTHEPAMFRRSFPRLERFLPFVDPGFSSGFWRRVMADD